jgi:pilus assembly protein CpaB
MNQNRMLIGFAVAIVVALLFSTYVYKQFKLATGQKTVVTTQRIVVAAVPLQLGTRIDANNLKTIPWPSSEPVVGTFARIEDCANRALITPVAANELIIESKLASREAGAGLPATIPEGMRAMSVAVNEVVGVAGFVIPGTMVDVLVTGKAVNGQGNDFVTRTILENVRVLAAGQKIEQDREGKPQTVPVITLLVAPEDAAKLAMSSTEGKIQLALRNTIDSKRVNPPTVMEAALFAGSAPPPAKHAAGKATPAAPPSPYVIEVITGNKRENKSFPNTSAEHP